MDMEPKSEREHIISLQGHITGVKRDIDHLKEDVKHVHQDFHKLGGKIDKIYWVVLSTVGAVVLIFLEVLFGMLK